MANLANLLATIAANVYTNHNNEVTAQMVKDALGAIVSTMGQGGYIYKGLATTSTNPSSPDANVFYIATAAGTYTNFGGIVVNAGEVAILKGTGTSWSKDVTGAATAAKLTELEQEVSEKMSDNETPTFTPGYHIATNGAYAVNAAEGCRATADYLDVSRASKVVAYLSGPYSSSAVICFYDKNKSVVSYVANNDNTQMVLRIVDVPDTAQYARFCGRTSDANWQDAFVGLVWSSKKILQLGQNVDNPEFIQVCTDSSGNIMWGVQRDGNFVFGNELPTQIRKALLEKVDKESGKSLIDTLVAESLSYIEDKEGRIDIKTDKDERILSYREKSGLLHEEAGIETPEATIGRLLLTKSGMTEFQQALKDAGFQPGGAGDFSDTEALELPQPKHYGMMNISVGYLPVNSGDIVSGDVEYYDFLGNYFKKSCDIEIQGQTSRIFAQSGGKGNYTLDITDGSEIKFGGWVPQDSFHLKGCAKDVTRGILATSYKWAYKMMQYLDAKPNRVLANENQITTTHASGKRFTDWPNDARCLPDGFPVELYINGAYWGLYAFQLKKHRSNYSMKKTDYTSFFLDPDAMSTSASGFQDGFWTGDIWWTDIDIKGPKTLICMDGSTFDGDNPKELIDSSSAYYDPNNANCVNTAITKAIIEAMPGKYQDVKDLIDASDLAGAKALFADNFDVNACILVYIFNCLMNNYDSIAKNTLWAVYKDGKIAPMLWDLDGMYGEGWIGNSASGPSAALWDGSYATAAWPLAILWTLYETEIKSAYAEMRANGIISLGGWRSVMFDEWVDKIGTEAFERDMDRWPETPSYRENYTNTVYWVEVGMQNGLGSYSAWNNSASYNVGARVGLRAHSMSPYYMIYEAVQANSNTCPVTEFYNDFPMVGGFYDSPRRMQKWMEAQIALCDSKLGYTE